jgi:pantetheine-phosphate adenylyltransferase
MAKRTEPTVRPPAAARARRAPRRAIFAGSFDPPTNGHVDLVVRGQTLFDEIVVAVGNNPAKRYLFSLDERLALVREVVASPKVEVVAFEGLLVDAARKFEAQVILRGLRGPADLELEMRNALANRELTGIETLWLPSEPSQAHVSSTLVREIAAYGGDVARYVPEAVLRAMKARRA